MRAFALPGTGRLVHLNNVSGGVLAGDELALDVELDTGAAAQITTTGATRLYRHRAGARDSAQQVTFLVGDGAHLEYLPDPVIPYAGSRHEQRTEIRLGRRATLFWWEALAPGRFAAGELFAFERLRVHTDVSVLGRPVLREDYLLQPRQKDLGSPVRMLGYSHMASLCVIQEGRPPAFWRTLEESLGKLVGARTSRRTVLWGATALPSGGILVRGLAVSGRFLYDGLVEFRRVAHIAISGNDPALPRKIL